ncbi:hypothetical protein C8R47DRAFT_1200760 [Mycena vitilis]|nr:hypothetical protein C8R47DRAFT_1200760 [Mycena vitilis]
MSSLPPGSDSDPAFLLPPDVARHLQVASLVIAGGLSVFIWDILEHLTDDYYLLFKQKFSFPTVMYFASRIASFVYVLGFTFFSTYPLALANCQTYVIAISVFYPIATGATSLLFVLRVRAIYGGAPLISWIFGFLWVCVLGTAVIVPISTRASAIGSLCIISDVPSYEGVPGTVVTIHDTSVFLAISCRLLLNHHNDRSREGKVQVLFRSLFRRANLHAFTEALLRDGQKYYMITVFSNVLTISMAYASTVNPIYRGMFSVPNIALTSILACRVHRNTKMHYASRSRDISLPVANNDSSGGRFTVPFSTDSYSMDTRRGATSTKTSLPPTIGATSITGVSKSFDFTQGPPRQMAVTPTAHDFKL